MALRYLVHISAAKMSLATHNPHKGVTLAIPWAIESTLWQAISHAECARMIVAKWPTTQGHKIAWPKPSVPNESNNWRRDAAYHMGVHSQFYWKSNRKRCRWSGSHPGAIHCSYQQFELSLSRFKDVLSSADVQRFLHGDVQMGTFPSSHTNTRSTAW